MPVDPLPHAWGRPAVKAVLRAVPEDFQVEEELGFSADGEGQHVLLRIRKRNSNTQWVARRLAHIAGVPGRAVGFAGLKDRFALTTQWFSVDLAGRKEPDWSVLGDPEMRVLEACRHGRKLRRGALRGNRFTLVLRHIEGSSTELERRLCAVRESGVPNYFGEQRFGRDGANLERAAAMFRGELRVTDRHRRGLYLSAARSLLFNRILARRVGDGTWTRALPGDVLMLAGSHSFFCAEELSQEIERRVAARDLFPSAPLWGKGSSAARDRALLLEQEVLQSLRFWCDGLEAAGLKQQRRRLLLLPEAFAWEWLPDGALRLRFSLPAGSYATMVVRELVAAAG